MVLFNNKVFLGAVDLAMACVAGLEGTEKFSLIINSHEYRIFPKNYSSVN